MTMMPRNPLNKIANGDALYSVCFYNPLVPKAKIWLYMFHTASYDPNVARRGLVAIIWLDKEFGPPTIPPPNTQTYTPTAAFTTHNTLIGPWEGLGSGPQRNNPTPPSPPPYTPRTPHYEGRHRMVVVVPPRGARSPGPVENNVVHIVLVGARADFYKCANVSAHP